MISLTSYPVCRGVSLHYSAGGPDVRGFKSSFITRTEYLKHRLKVSDCTEEARPPLAVGFSAWGGNTLPGRRRRWALLGEGKVQGRERVPHLSRCFRPPPEGALAREVRVRWPCPVFRCEAGGCGSRDRDPGVVGT